MATVTQCPPVFIALTREGEIRAREFFQKLGNGEIHGYRKRISDADYFFDDPVQHIRTLVNEGRDIIAFCAVPIVVRAAGSIIKDKNEQPAVLAVSEDGQTIVPILGVHHGATAIAQKIKLANSHVAITNASDSRLGIALDDPPTGWTLGNTNHYKAFIANALETGICRIDEDLNFIRVDTNADSPLSIISSIEQHSGSEHQLVFHPHKVVIGVGCERNCSFESLKSLVDNTLQRHNLAPQSIAAITSIELKMDEAAIHELARYYAVPARFFSAEQLDTYRHQLANPSERVFKEVGVYGVAEAAALAATDTTLHVNKQKNQHATCAISVANTVIPAPQFGRARGHLSIVGTGPGRADWCVPAVRSIINRATDIVGYSLYLDLLGAQADGKTRHDFPLGNEIERCKHALDLAAQGKRVALVCSGDPGIYAMASLVFELLHDADKQHTWHRSHIEVIPGISAFQAASALAGAVIGHDFCTISLSDLLTPWQQIESRIEAAAAGDFVIAFYNPVSKERHWQLNRARDILLQYRSENTPVVLGRNLGRDEESLRILPLGDLKSDDVDMLTLVMVGSSQTQHLQSGSCQRLFTPRGYADKSEYHQLTQTKDGSS